MTVEEARSAIEAVAQWLEGYDPPPASGGERRRETKSAKLAREFANTLLDASTADGYGGCSLCLG